METIKKLEIEEIVIDQECMNDVMGYIAPNSTEEDVLDLEKHIPTFSKPQRLD